MNKVAFLDRDGVINIERGKYIETVDEFELTEGIIEVLKFLKSEGYIFVVTTNQGGIARQLYTFEILADIHAKMQNLLAKENIFFEDIFFCSHHPNYGLCFCRKPDSLMLEKGIAKYKADLQKSFMIGDTERDEGAANKAGVPFYKIDANKINLLDFKIFYHNLIA